MYELFKAREAQAKAYWTKCVLESRDLKAALGLDDTTFLTHMKLLAEMEAGGMSNVRASIHTGTNNRT
jgi:hypothetical protein